MRVTYVCADPGVPVFGSKGASVHVQEVLRAFVRRGDDVDLVCVRRGGTAPAGLEGVAVHEVADDRAVGEALDCGVGLSGRLTSSTSATPSPAGPGCCTPSTAACPASSR